MISIGIVLTILVVHYIADFILQTREQAAKKSTSNEFLFSHILIYTACMILVGVFLCSGSAMLWFPLITGITHYMIDWYTSRLNRYLYHKGDAHNFFVGIGFDQLLHYIQLFVTYLILT